MAFSVCLLHLIVMLTCSEGSTTMFFCFYPMCWGTQCVTFSRTLLCCPVKLQRTKSITGSIVQNFVGCPITASFPLPLIFLQETVVMVRRWSVYVLWRQWDKRSLLLSHLCHTLSFLHLFIPTPPAPGNGRGGWPFLVIPVFLPVLAFSQS